jgi:myo-inositol-1(or 4)-monophosphatase
MSLFSNDIFYIKNALFIPSKIPFMRGADLVSKIGKDYNELESLQSSFKKTDGFVYNLLETIKNELLEYFEKKNYTIEYEGKIVEYEYKKGDDFKKDFNFKNKESKIIIVIDGKMNLLHSVPYFCVAIALEQNSEIVGGIISNPITQELFITEKSRGTFVNERRVRVSQRENDNECIIANRNMLTNSRLLDICYVACGKYDGAIIKKNKHINKLAYLMVREAGGFVEEKDNKIVISNGKIKL